MSISTHSICSYQSCEASCSSDNQVEGWRQELINKVNVYAGDIDSYLETFVPSRTPCPNRAPDASIAADFEPQGGQELASYVPIMDILGKIVSGFPQGKELSFYDCHSQLLAFPFSAFAKRHHCAKPDITVSFPGEILPKKITSPDWSRFSMAIEAKGTDADDPFVKGDTVTHTNTIVQLAVNARSLIFAHDLLAAFVFGIYGDVVRIVRFDHACAVVSPPIELKSAEGLKSIRDFFWRFVHPWEGAGPKAIVGRDTTIRKLGAADRVWLIERLGDESEDLLKDVDLREARIAKTWNEGPLEESKTFILFKLIDVNARLFSRATMVWLGIEDTRRPMESEATDAKKRGKTKKRKRYDDDGPELRIIKQYWRQLVRIPEPKFYLRLQECIPEEEWVGLPGFVCGGDLGARDVERWQAACKGEPWRGDDDLRTPPLPTSHSESGPAVPSAVPPSPEQSGPLPYPMHQTWSFRLTKGDEFKVKERSQMRFAVDTVGRPLSRFKSTKEFVMAMRDAVRGHQLAKERAGVLHRDISSGNILIVDRPVPGGRPQSAGILHDYDYSSMTLVPPSSGTGSDSETLQEEDSPALYPLELSREHADAARCKERTGTYYFMAMDLLVPSRRQHPLHDSCHDLESVYWVLVWIILRHTRHDHEKGGGACSELFIYGKDKVATAMKQNFVMWDATDIHIEDNEPLTELFHAFSTLVSKANAGRSDSIPLTYEKVLEAFDHALARDDWPEDDKALPFDLKTGKTQTVFVQPLDSGASKITQQRSTSFVGGSGLVSGQARAGSGASGRSKRRRVPGSPTPKGSGGSDRVLRPRAIGSAPSSARIPSHTSRRGSGSTLARGTGSGGGNGSGGRRVRSAGTKKASGA